jgi:apolipoprotein N-acyltransferase
MAAIDREVAEAPPVTVGIVQGNTPHEGISLRDALTLYRDATRKVVQARKVDLVVWPESALNGVVPQGRVESLMREAVEAPTRTTASTVPVLAGTFIKRGDAMTNSAVLFAGDQVRGVYDKVHPLAFGEYVPLSDVFPALFGWIKNAGSLTPGTNEDALVLGDRKISPLICYEDILPAAANHAIAHAEPDLLVNMTNDSWFGNTAVASIHLALAKMRAVEHRRYLVHATNSGMSAFIDPVGRATGLTPVLKEVAEVQTLHWMRSRTVYERIGDFPWWCAALVVAAMAVVRRQEASRAPIDS